MKRALTLIFISLVLPLTSAAEPLLKTTTTWEGEPIHYPTGNAEVTSVKLRIEPGQDTAFHCHPVPTLGYILQGSVEVETTSGKSAVFAAGEPLVEVLNTLHRGKAMDGPAEILVFYAGAEGMPTTVLASDDLSKSMCKRQ